MKTGRPHIHIDILIVDITYWTQTILRDTTIETLVNRIGIPYNTAWRILRGERSAFYNRFIVLPYNTLGIDTGTDIIIDDATVREHIIQAALHNKGELR